ncbi:hypothetical protein ACFWBI_05700 [Streptomyces sp. NPDC059982]|uniref:hypothetical protein n=1 Tax=Streptomyces sp. NPDC059982 TaxID=3347024 RepID=UPI00369FDB90
MGRLWDAYLGTRRPDPAVQAVTAAELREVLLAVGAADVPFTVGEAGGRGADLVASWQVTEPPTGSGPARRQVERTFKIWLRLVPGEREVHAMDEQWAVTRAGAPPGRTVQREHGRGPIRRVQKEWSYERGPDGSRHKVVSFDLHVTRDMKDPLRDAVLAAGWTWRGARKS